jgi:hypothetical protein
MDGPFGTAMDLWFRKDQQDHIADGRFRVLLSSDQPGELERRNEDLIKRYQQIMSASQPNSWIVQQQGQIARSARTLYPSNSSSQRPLASSTIAAPYSTMKTPPIPQNTADPPGTGQMGQIPTALVLQGSSPGAVPSSQMV